MVLFYCVPNLILAHKEGGSLVVSKIKTMVLAYYFPNWHRDSRNDVWHGKGWTEWDVLQCARPRFEGHRQPRVPLWGYEDEALPAIMEKKISTAVNNGIDGFISDWYWFEDGGYRLRCIDEGFLGARNNEDAKFGSGAESRFLRITSKIKLALFPAFCNT